jgi:hypothetical protein
MKRSRLLLSGLVLLLVAGFVTGGVALADEPSGTTGSVPPLVAALKQTFAAETMRYRYQMFFSDPYREIELLTLDGEQKGENSRATVGGKLAEWSGIAGTQAILYGDKYYYDRGGVWYVTDRSARSAFKVEIKKSLSPELTEFGIVGSEDVDGQICEVYSIDKQAARDLVEANEVFTAEEMTKVVNIEVTYWVCPDGYVRRMRTRSDTLRPDGGTNIVRLEEKYFDFGAPIEITPPADAQPAP